MGTLIKLNPALAAFIVGGLTMAMDALIALVQKSDIAKTGLTSVKLRLIETVNALADSDPDDAKQMEKIWLTKFVGQDVHALASGQFEVGLSKIESENLRRIAAHVGGYGLEVVKILTDEIKPNEAQLREHLAQFFEDPETEAIIVQDYVRRGLQAAADAIRGGEEETP